MSQPFSFGSPVAPAAQVQAESSLIVIPARLASTRLPRKMLLNETGKPLIQHTYEAALTATLPHGVCVAADDPQIAMAVRHFGGAVIMTCPQARSGADRCAEIAEMVDVDLIVNMQGDEPELPGEAIDLAIQALRDHPECVMSTLATPIRSRTRLHDPSCVKVVADDQGRALYFSRCPIPYASGERLEMGLGEDPPRFLQHLGLYVYRREFLATLARLPSSSLEQAEQLEQLRVLQAGYAIHVSVTPHSAKGIDTAEDYREFVQRQRTRAAA